LDQLVEVEKLEVDAQLKSQSEHIQRLEQQLEQLS
jgi:hypothetical protein